MFWRGIECLADMKVDYAVISFGKEEEFICFSCKKVLVIGSKMIATVYCGECFILAEKNNACACSHVPFVPRVYTLSTPADKIREEIAKEQKMFDFSAKIPIYELGSHVMMLQLNLPGVDLSSN